MTTIQIRDEESAGKPLDEFSLDVLTEQITVRELIRSRIYQQVQDKILPSPVFGGIVAPSETEEALNLRMPQKRKPTDWKGPYELAIKAYEKNHVIVIVDDKQTGSLDEQIQVHADTRISFVRLVPLVGG